jgi:hypothetical protein
LAHGEGFVFRDRGKKVSVIFGNLGRHRVVSS